MLPSGSSSRPRRTPRRPARACPCTRNAGAACAAGAGPRLGRQVPERHVQGPGGHGPITVPAWLLVRQEDLSGADRVDDTGIWVSKPLRGGLESREEAFGEDAGLSVAAVRVEAVADEPLPVHDDVADGSHHRYRHRGEVDDRVAHPRSDRGLGDLDLGDAHPHLIPASCGRAAGRWSAGSGVGRATMCCSGGAVNARDAEAGERR